MIDEKESASVILWQESLPKELTNLIQLGIWAREHGIPAIKHANLKHDYCGVIEDAFDALTPPTERIEKE